ncbi:hypothetical protein ACYOEI_18710 [Singulisphaera rosea]
MRKTDGAELFRYSGRFSPIITDPINIEPHQLVISLRYDPSRIETLEKKVEALVGSIKDGLLHIRELVDHYNSYCK